MRRVFHIAAVLLAATCTARSAPAAVEPAVPDEEAYRIGQAIYRDGVLPSGEPIEAFVQGDILVDGTMFTCISCHLRSGLGSNEGTVVTPPTSGPRLFTPRPLGDALKRPGTPQAKSAAWGFLRDVHRGEDLRPAYTPETLATALRDGTDPVGKVFDPIMPRYFLDDRDMGSLISYLEQLSSEHSPGVDDTTLRLATVVTAGVDPTARQAMLSVLETYVRDHNTQSRGDQRRAQKGPFSRQEMDARFRLIDLSIWTLEGPPDTWRKQLEAYYEKKPVFALVGGLAEGSWAPVHVFCEENQIPCLFPITELPVISDSDWYTQYFSKGLYQEGEAAARYLRAEAHLPADASVVQVYRQGDDGAALASGFSQASKAIGRAEPRDWVLKAGEEFSREQWEARVTAQDPSVVAVWCEPKDIAQVGGWLAPDGGAPLILLSHSLMEGKLAALPETLRSRAHVTYPYILERAGEIKKRGVRAWFKARGIEVTNFEVQAKAYFLVKMLSAMLMDMRSEFYRDYFFDVLDMMIDQTYMIAVYPRLSFGPGQRYASKGCYVMRIEGDALVPETDWVIH